ncbi:MAG: anthranilate phosphoribosyltransferase [Planctomycetes bacterium]|nr:anthranilate phosphoribosyltransferase [Planctomycetota bacterium]
MNPSSDDPVPALLRDLAAGRALRPDDFAAAVGRAMDGQADPVAFGGLLAALSMRPVAAELLAAAAAVIRARAVRVHAEVRPLVDTCGTGGDGAGTFNVSTAAACVVAGAGCAVAKHGNRAVSSAVGSADVLVAAGCALELEPAAAKTALDAVGFVFLFAPRHHPAFRHVAPIRKSLGVRTIFNLLGPLCNPAGADRQLVGVYDPVATLPVAEALRELGSERALVVHCDGLDEIGLHATTRGHLLQNGSIAPFELDARELGFERTPLAALRGGDLPASLAMLRSALGGQDGARSAAVTLNAGAALFVAGVAKDLEHGVELARETMARGAGLRVLERYAETSRRLAGGTAGDRAQGVA